MHFQENDEGFQDNISCLLSENCPLFAKILPVHAKVAMRQIWSVVATNLRNNNLKE